MAETEKNLALVREGESTGLSATLWGTDNPSAVIQRASKVAKVLADVIEKQKLFTVIGGKKHVWVEGWQTLGAMVGVYAIVVWTRKLENGWEARVEARTKDGYLVGAAESECLNTENNWSEAKKKEDHHLRSMAQTRATSKAIASALRFIMPLAGYAGTPAEEMPPTPEDRVFQGRTGKTVERPREKGPTPPATGTPMADSMPAPEANGAAPSGDVWTGLVQAVTYREVTFKKGKKAGEKGKVFAIKTKDGKTFSTFSESFAEEAKYASENDEPVSIKFSTSDYKGTPQYNVEELAPTGESPAAEPGGEG
jgi:hypothetical protein